MHSYRVSPDAGLALEEIWLYIASDNPQAADHVMIAAKKSIEQIACTPGIGKRFETQNARLADLRIWPVCGFEHYLIFYRVQVEEIEIAYIWHSARDIEALIAT